MTTDVSCIKSIFTLKTILDITTHKILGRTHEAYCVQTASIFIPRQSIKNYTIQYCTTINIYNSPEQCSKNSSVTGTSKSCEWSNLKVIESRPEEQVTGYSGLTTGGTAILSGWFQNEYWQNTKFESESGKPVACLIVTC